MINKLLALQEQLRQDGVLITFCGRFSQEIIEELGEAVKKYLETEEQPKSDIVSIFSIFIEQTQNIKNYSASKDGTPKYDAVANSGIVTIGNDTAGHKYIVSGNLVEQGDVQALKARLDSLIQMDKQELKLLYRKLLREELPPGSTSAGLGLVDIAKRASLPLEYSFIETDGDCSFFTLKAVV